MCGYHMQGFILKAHSIKITREHIAKPMFPQTRAPSPFCFTNSYFYSFVLHTTSLWNSLPNQDIINLSTEFISFFKHHLCTQ